MKEAIGFVFMSSIFPEIWNVAKVALIFKSRSRIEADKLKGYLISDFINSTQVQIFRIFRCLLCHFATGATPSSQFRVALLTPQDSYGNFHRLTDKCCLYHLDRPNHPSLIWYSYYASHSHRYKLYNRYQCGTF